MAAQHKRRRNDDGQAQTRTLGVLVAVMVVAGVVALIMTVFGSNSTKGEAAGQPSGSQVGNQTSTAPSTSPSSTSPSSSASTTSAVPSTPAATSATPKTATATPKPTPATASTKVVKYTVRKGDNLTLIASWFSQRGYGLVYDWNKSVIGKNPNLIYPGQTIIVSLTGDKMNVSTRTK